MFCEHCGNILPDKAKFCGSCGAPVVKKPEPQQQKPNYEYYTAPQSGQPSHPQPYGQVQEQAPVWQAKPSVGFLEAIGLFFMNYTNFRGRSRRSEYWYSVLFTALVNLVVASVLPDLAAIPTLAFVIPNTAIIVRRLHDIGKSGWWYFISWIPLVGGIWMLVYMCRDSEGTNQWGESPKY